MGFLAPWLMSGLVLLSVPVFVHLLRRHITVPRPVGSLMFFERGTQSSAKHRRLKHLLLFALRFALLLLLVLAFAGPFIRRPANDPNGRLLMIVIDHSFSMRAGTRLVDAKQQALVLLAPKPPAQKAQVMEIGGQLTLLTQPTADASQLRLAVEAVVAGDGHADYGELGRNMRTLTETLHTPVDLHLFSDMQRTSMPGNFADMVMPPSVTLTLHSVAKGSALPNWTVETVKAPAELADPKDLKQSRVQAVVVGFNSPAAAKKVLLVVDGRVIATKVVNVPASGRAAVEFAPLEIGYGFNRCEVRLEPDAFAFDDAAFFSVQRTDPQRVLFLHASGDTRSQVYYGAALNAAAQASFVLQAATPESATDIDPTRFAFVVLDDVVSLPPIFERTLTQYVAKGGSVLLVLGTHTAEHVALPVFGGQIRAVHNYVRSGLPTSVAQVDFTHPALQQTEPSADNGGWAAAKIFYAAEVDAGAARVVARLSDGTPLFMDRQVGEGHVMLLTSGFDNITNDLPLHPVFVALVDKTARYLAGGERLSGSRRVDDFVALRAGGTPVGETASVEVVDPLGRRPLSLAAGRTAQTFPLSHAGFYQVRFASGKDAVIGVNPDTRESDLAPMPDDVQQLWSGNNQTLPAQTAPTQAAETKTVPVSLWWYVMLLACAVALAEAALSSGYMGVQREDA